MYKHTNIQTYNIQIYSVSDSGNLNRGEDPDPPILDPLDPDQHFLAHPDPGYLLVG